MRYNLAPCTLLFCCFLGGILAGCKSMATSFHRMHNELTSELIKEDADEDTHYYGAWFTWSPSSNSKAAEEKSDLSSSKISDRAAPERRCHCDF